MNHSASYISHDHPSFGVSQSWYIFAMQVKGVITKLFLVNAENPWAIQCIERLLGDDQRVSPTCVCISVHRECKIGVRNDLMEVLSFQEFVTVIARQKFLDDGLAIEAFQNAVSGNNPQQSLKALPAPKKPESKPVITTVGVQAGATVTSDKPGKNYATVRGGLIGFGFKPAEIDPVLASMGNFEKRDYNEVMHAALQRLSP